MALTEQQKREAIEAASYIFTNNNIDDSELLSGETINGYFYFDDDGFFRTSQHDATLINSGVIPHVQHLDFEIIIFGENKYVEFPDLLTAANIFIYDNSYIVAPKLWEVYDISFKGSIHSNNYLPSLEYINTLDLISVTTSVNLPVIKYCKQVYVHNSTLTNESLTKCTVMRLFNSSVVLPALEYVYSLYLSNNSSIVLTNKLRHIEFLTLHNNTTLIMPSTTADVLNKTIKHIESGEIILID